MKTARKMRGWALSALLLIGFLPVDAHAAQSQSPSPCAHGTIEPVSLPLFGGKKIAGRVYTPPHYEPSNDKRYPVLVLLHGANATDDQWADVGIADAADALICAKSITPMVIALPDGGKGVPVELDQYVATSLVPWLDSTYRTKADGSHRSVGGISRGGGAALRIGAAHPGLFASVGGHSPALSSSVASLVPGLKKLRGGVFLDVGTQDALVPFVTAMSKTLTKSSVRNQLHVWAGEHDRPYWRAHATDYLKFYSRSWKHASASD